MTDYNAAPDFSKTVEGIRASDNNWEKNIYEPFAKQVQKRVEDQIKAGGYKGNMDGDLSVKNIAESVTRALCALSNGDSKRANDEAIKQAIQKRMEELGYDGYDAKTGGYTA